MIIQQSILQQPPSGFKKNVQNKQLKNPTFGSNSNTVATEVAGILFKYARIINDGSCGAGELIEKFCTPIVNKVKTFIEEGKQIPMAMPAFPFKSKSPHKVIGTEADMAERNCITLFKNIIANIKQVYPKGAKIKVYSDGFPIARAYDIDDCIAEKYLDKMRAFIAQAGTEEDIEVITLKDFYGNDLNAARKGLMQDFGRTSEEIREQVQTDPLMNSDFCGIKRFLTEEQKVLHPELGTNQVSNKSKRLTYEIIKCAEAWSNLMEKAEETSLRISCHPQPAGARKIGIRLSANSDNWITPWQASAVRLNDGVFVLMKRAQAEELSLNLVTDHAGQPSHFELPTNVCPSERKKIVDTILDISPLCSKEQGIDIP